jgi:6-phosphogluconolactonase (cycloisomerase 2 family)
MRTRFPWIVAILALVAIGFLLACSTKYSANSSTNGLVVVPSQGSAVMESFSINLASGSASQINNVNGPPTPGLPTSVILDPSGAYAYVLMHQSAALVPSVTGIGVFPIESDGKLGAATTTTLNPTSPVVNVVCGSQNIAVSVQPTPVVPGSILSGTLTFDSPGKLLFVADVATPGETQPYMCNGSMVTSNVTVPGAVSVFAVGSGTLAEVPGSPFSLPVAPGGSAPSASALAVTPTAYPIQYSYCSGHTPPTTENLYVTDSVNYVLLNYSVDPSAGTLTLMPYSISSPGIPTGQVPSGVAVDPCNRFVYVANAQSHNVSAFAICSAINLLSTPPCSSPDFSLNQIASPYPAVNSPGPITVDAYGKWLYVVNTGSSNISGYEISPTTGVLQAFGGLPVAAGLGANSIAIRGDNSWLFVANTNATSVSQYALNQSNGTLNPVGAINTLDYPSGVAVK